MGVIRDGGGSGLVLDVRDLLKEQEVGFQHQIDRAKAASDETTQLSALMSYQLQLRIGPNRSLRFALM